MVRKEQRILFFRPEQKASALPSPRGSRVGIEIKSDTTLRLYCVRINEDIVILCSGDIKTKDNAQDCPNVSYHFRLANKISQKIDEAQLDFYSGEELGFYI